LTDTQPLRRIAFIGSGLRLALSAALTAQRCASGATQILVINCSDGKLADGMTVLRPEMHHLHNDIGLQDIALDTKAESLAIYAVNCKLGGESVVLPFSDYGMARDGTAFHHHWLRGKQLGNDRALNEFSPALAVHNGKEALPLQLAAKIGIPYGMRVGIGGYAQLLMDCAVRAGAKIIDGPDAEIERAGSDYAYAIHVGNDKFDIDFLIDVSEDGRFAKPVGVEQAGWKDAAVWPSHHNQPDGIETLKLYRAVQCFLDLLPSRATSNAEMREYNRLMAAQEERIADMTCLLKGEMHAAKDRPALRRKIEVFQACGRIVIEDYEVFGAPEWLAVLMAVVGDPQNYDRLADRLPDAELLSWLADLQCKIGQLKIQLENI